MASSSAATPSATSTRPPDVWLQSFVEADVDYWTSHYPTTFGRQAVFLDGTCMLQGDLDLGF